MRVDNRPLPRVSWVADAAYPPRSGIGNYTYQLIRGLLELSVPVNLIHWGKREQIFDRATTETVLPDWMKARFIRRVAPSFHPEVCRRADLIHFPTEFDLYYARPGRALRVVTIHGCAAAKMPLRLHHRISGALIRRISRALKKVEGIITVSKSSAEEIEETYGVANNKIKIIHNGVSRAFHETSREDPVWYRRKFGIGGPYALSVGLMIPKKNQICSLRVMKRLAEKGYPHILVQVGQAGPLEGKLKETSDNLGIGGRLITVGFQEEEDLAKLYAGADFLLFPSYHEGFGLPVAEAMASGCPVIASRIPAVEEVTQRLFPLFDPEDDEGMATEAVEILKNSDYRQSRIHIGKERASFFSWNKSAETLLRYYQSLIERFRSV